MASRRRTRGRRAIARAATVLSRARSACRRTAASAARAIVGRLRPWKPAVAVDVRGQRGRRLRGTVGRVTREHLRALGVQPPAHLLVVVQRSVADGDRPLAALLQVFDDGARRRHVLFLALSSGNRQLSDDDVVATLRQQLHQVVGDELGTLQLSAPVEPVRAPQPAPVVPIRREPEPPPFDDAPPAAEAFDAYDGDAFAVGAQR